MIRAARPDETAALVNLADSTGIFAPGEAAALLGGVLASFHDGQLGDGHQVVVAGEDEGRDPQGWAYFAPHQHAQGVWDLWWIGVSPAAHGKGLGDALLDAAERAARDAGARILIIETSTDERLARARRFYERRGYRNCGTIPHFYGVDEGKVTFARRIDG